MSDIINAYQEGRDAYWDDKYPDDNPFSTDYEQKEWLKGYYDAEDERMDTIMNAYSDPFMECISLMMFCILVLGSVSILIKIFF